MDSINTPFNLTNYNYSNTTPITIKAEDPLNSNGLTNNNFDINENMMTNENYEATVNSVEFKTKFNNPDIYKD